MLERKLLIASLQSVNEMATVSRGVALASVVAGGPRLREATALDSFERIAEALGVETAELFTGTNPVTSIDTT